MSNKIYIIDVTNRDGVQTANLGLAKLEKTIINIYLAEMGIFQSEFGFPVTNHETNYLNANIDLASKGVMRKMRLSGWARAIVKDVEESVKMVPGLKYINLSMSTSDQMISNKFKGKIDRPKIISNSCDSVKLAKDLGLVSVGINAEDASRTNVDFLVEFASRAKEAGADRFRYCDTLGYDDPFTIYENIAYIAKNVKIDIELHCHNDLGMVVANSVAGAKAAIDNGVDAYINTTINGLGERAGNADLVSTILALKKSSGYSNSEKYVLDEKIDLSKAWKLAKYASYAFGVPIPMNQPGVGKGLAENLENFGMSCFVAHDSIQPSTLWKNEILKALKTMDGLIEFITDNFYESVWTNQELGFAEAREVPIFLYSFNGWDPKGFKFDIQAIKSGENSLIEIIKKHFSSRYEIRDFLLNNFYNAVNGTFDNAKTKFLEIIHLKFSNEEIDKIVSAIKDGPSTYSVNQLIILLEHELIPNEKRKKYNIQEFYYYELLENKVLNQHTEQKYKLLKHAEEGRRKYYEII